MSNKNMNSREKDTAVNCEKVLKNGKTKWISAAAALFVAVFAAGTGCLMNKEEIPLTADLNECINVQSAEKIVLPPKEYDVKIVADGRNYAVKCAGTVEDALEKANIDVNDDDLINIGFSEPLNPDTEIVINRVDIIEEVQVEVIDYATKYQENDDYVVGYAETVVEGEEGEVETTLRHVYVDGELVSSAVIDEDVTEPVDEVVVVGTKEYNPIDDVSISQIPAPLDLQFDENGVPLDYSEVLTGKSTAYSAKAGARTASGRLAQVGTVAVDPNLIPYGSELYIVSTDGIIYGYAIAADTGTALTNGSVLVDVFMESYEASCSWGAKQVNVYVLN